ncbi:SRPBCC family protein [Jongsikchunia kroppenstedtii]|uniref:SRPBCC family protein n=1 Tax=Jongsikchunia kroppenstedtii TaxID=1121721 RepID=UPI000375836B|nr:SRPBCC family protein [Jongsikchunia kroppenstedtii]
MATPLIEDSIDIDATPETVWALVSDLQRMGDWSPQARKVFVRGPIRLGATTVNVNRAGWKVWPTRSKVIQLEANKEIAFKVLDNGTVWSYHLEPTATGTKLTERRVAKDGKTTPISAFLVDKMLGGNDSFEDDLRAGIRQTLQGIKAAAERG